MLFAVNVTLNLSNIPFWFTITTESHVLVFE